MRKYYLDNIRWTTIILVIVYHVIYMFNGIATAGVIGPFCEKQYQEGIQYILYPRFMVLLFLIAGMCSRYYLEKHTIRACLKYANNCCLPFRNLRSHLLSGLLCFRSWEGYRLLKPLPDSSSSLVYSRHKKGSDYHSRKSQKDFSIAPGDQLLQIIKIIGKFNFRPLLTCPGMCWYK